VRARGHDAELNVFGTGHKFGPDLPRWDIDTDLDTGLTEAASTLYYFYLDENGDSVISDLAPMDRRSDLKGLYHPFETWRCVGQAFNNASSDFEAVISYEDESEENYAITQKVASNALTLQAHASPVNLLKFKSTTADDSIWELIPILPGTSFVASSGSTIGTTSATDENIFAHLVAYSKRAELSLAKDLIGEGRLVSTTAEGGAGAADSLVLYSTAARTSVPVRPLSKLFNNQTTAGTWAAALTKINLWPFGIGDSDFTIKVIPTSGTWTKPTGLVKAVVISTGGGAGGGAAAGSDHSAAGGGGAGGTVIELFNAADLGATETVTIGAGGASATGGGNTTFGSTHTASGGSAGASTTNNTGATGTAVQGGSGGAAANGLLNLVGGGGNAGSVEVVSAAVGGTGGASFWGGGAEGGNDGSGGNAGSYGAGGGGGGNIGGSTRVGGAGKDGVVVVIEFYA
jgi:hypothetical protein